MRAPWSSGYIAHSAAAVRVDAGRSEAERRAPAVQLACRRNVGAGVEQGLHDLHGVGRRDLTLVLDAVGRGVDQQRRDARRRPRRGPRPAVRRISRRSVDDDDGRDGVGRLRNVVHRQADSRTIVAPRAVSAPSRRDSACAPARSGRASTDARRVVHLAVEFFRREAERVLVMQLVGDAREGRRRDRSARSARSSRRRWPPRSSAALRRASRLPGRRRLQPPSPRPPRPPNAPGSSRPRAARRSPLGMPFWPARPIA